MIQTIAIICDQSPIGKNSAIEAIRLGSGFLGLGEEIRCKVIYMGDSVYVLSKFADPTVIGMNSFEEPLEMADLSELEIYIHDNSLKEAGLSPEDLIDYENLKIVDIEVINEIIEHSDTTFRY